MATPWSRMQAHNNFVVHSCSPSTSTIEESMVERMVYRNKKAAWRPHVSWCPGGDGEIRTHGPLRVGGFQDRWIKPLSHVSGVGGIVAAGVFRPGCPPGRRRSACRAVR